MVGQSRLGSSVVQLLKGCILYAEGMELAKQAESDFQWAELIKPAFLAKLQSGNKRSALAKLKASATLTGNKFRQQAGEALAELWVLELKDATGRKLTDAELEVLGKALRRQFDQGIAEDGNRYGLDQLALELTSPEPPSEAEISRRLGMYGRSSTIGLYAVRRASSGLPFEVRVLDNTLGIEHCEKCISYAQQGPLPAGEHPLPGEKCPCGPNCHCKLIQISNADAQTWNADWGPTLQALLEVNQGTYDSSIP